MKVQSTKQLEEEMRAVARGERPAAPDSVQPSIESAVALIRLLTPEPSWRRSGFWKCGSSRGTSIPSIFD